MAASYIGSGAFGLHPHEWQLFRFRVGLPNPLRDRSLIHEGGILLWEETSDLSCLRGNKTAGENNLLLRRHCKIESRKEVLSPFP